PATATTETDTLSLHDALPIFDQAVGMYPGDAEDVPHAVADETIDDRLPGGYDFLHWAMLTVPRSRSDGCLTRVHVTPSARRARPDRKSTRLNSSHVKISYAVF